ncbi:hypothetical protein SARC_10857 [Sphaeroforma arctica JP610]|uniref:Importin N-terminal domain-containing protein n=1 Tax=Sphaeroforma arctica JP610 TaxID=667725 RepID=A0A0L0FIQ5_9EUKA|nr:hypothetical protein SARC_10857 [Sphaeroforma arctica JP610]KNC76654.1 hypothetical protein SARC_10857 [Sphaeroforma arctica JP610]|eukprot:XP_014150556.1 hypothetical protein SARC_10857 [Sphaeroforma arctica JP610]
MQANTAANGPPLNTADVYPLIVASATQDANVVQQAYGKLKQAEIRPGFFTALFEIMCQRAYINNQGQLHDHARQIAIIYFKNGVDRYWRKRARNGISEQEKQILRYEL